MNYLVSYINDKGSEQKELFESSQMVSGFIEQLLHMNQARPEDIKIYQLEQLGFHVETIPVVKIDSGPDSGMPYESPYEEQPVEVGPELGSEESSS